MIDTKKLSIAVRTKRGRRSLRDIEGETGLTNATLSLIENEKVTNPRYDTLDGLCRWLDLPMDYFRLEPEKALDPAA